MIDGRDNAFIFCKLQIDSDCRIDPSIQMATSPWRKYTPWPAIHEYRAHMLHIDPDPSHLSVSALSARSRVNPFPHLWNYDVVHGGIV